MLKKLLLVFLCMTQTALAQPTVVSCEAAYAGLADHGNNSEAIDDAAAEEEIASELQSDFEESGAFAELVSDPEWLQALESEHNQFALEFNRDFILKKAERLQAARSWSKAIQDIQAQGRKLSVIEHTTLQLILRTKELGLIDGLDEETSADLNNSFVKSWTDLGGTSMPFEKIINQPLPKAILKTLPKNIRDFHLLSLRTDPDTMTVRPPGSFLGAMRKAMPMMLISFGLTHAFGLSNGAFLDTLSAGAVGLTVTYLEEYLFHRFIMHGGFGGKRLPKFLNSPLIPKILKQTVVKHANFHASHHFLASPSRYVVDDSGVPVGMTQDQVRDQLLKRGVNPAHVDLLQNEANWGLHGEPDFVSMAVSMSPPAAILAALAGGDHPLYSAAVAALVSQLWIFNIYVIHRYHHLTESEVKNQSALVRWYLNTSMFRSAVVFHAQHHLNTSTNFHLLPGINLDAPLGTEEQPSLEKIILLLLQDLNI